MFIEKCDIQNLSAGGATCETQKQHAAPMELDCGIMVLSINISLLAELFTVFFQNTKVLQNFFSPFPAPRFHEDMFHEDEFHEDMFV